MSGESAPAITMDANAHCGLLRSGRANRSQPMPRARPVWRAELWAAVGLASALPARAISGDPQPMSASRSRAKPSPAATIRYSLARTRTRSERRRQFRAAATPVRETKPRRPPPVHVIRIHRGPRVGGRPPNNGFSACGGLTAELGRSRVAASTQPHLCLVAIRQSDSSYCSWRGSPVPGASRAAPCRVATPLSRGPCASTAYARGWITGLISGPCNRRSARLGITPGVGQHGRSHRPGS